MFSHNFTSKKNLVTSPQALLFVFDLEVFCSALSLDFRFLFFCFNFMA